MFQETGSVIAGILLNPRVSASNKLRLANNSFSWIILFVKWKWDLFLSRYIGQGLRVSRDAGTKDSHTSQYLFSIYSLAYLRTGLLGRKEPQGMKTESFLPSGRIFDLKEKWPGWPQREGFPTTSKKIYLSKQFIHSNSFQSGSF